jgi:colanic acid biosynthesis protein WcaH
MNEPKPGEWLPADAFQSIIRLTPLVSIDLIARSRDDRILVGLRKHEPARGVYFVPGSRITKNESLEGAFGRITREELGGEYSISQARFLGVYEHFYPTNRFEVPGFGTHYIVLGYELGVKREDLTLLPKDQHGDYAWMPVAELLSDPKVHENTKAYFRGPRQAGYISTAR